MEKLSTTLAILIIIFTVYFLFISPSMAVVPSTVASSSVELATLEAFQRKTFFANTRYWVFYSDGVNVNYKTSIDGLTWSSPTYVCPGGHGQAFSVWFDETYVHYVKGPQGIGEIKYCKGKPNPDGTISWSAPEQTAFSSYTLYIYECYICVDTEGCPWIGYRWGYDGAGRYPNCTKSSLNNGTWHTASGFPYQLSTTSTGDWICSIVPLTNRKVYAIYLPAGAVRGRLWDGTTWRDEEVITTAGIMRRFAHSVVAHNDDVHIAFLQCPPTYDILYFKRTYGNGWGIQEIIQTSQTPTSYPALSVDTNTGEIYCFWGNNDIIHYKKRTNGTWDPTATTWISESDLIENTMTCFYQGWGFKIGIVWTQGTQNPYNVRFASVNLPVTYRYLHLRTYMNDLATPLSSALVIMNNGSDQVKLVDSYGWANFTGITTASVTVKVKWQNSWVNGSFAVTMESDKTINIRCRVYSVDFTNSFKDSEGNPLYTNPSSFKEICPNGTVTSSLRIGTYCLQNGTYTWNEVIWQGTNVAPTHAGFDPTDGNPAINLNIYSPTFQVYKPDGQQFATTKLNIKSPNGTVTPNVQCNSSGLKSFHQIQAGSYRFNVTTSDGFVAQVNFVQDVSATQTYYINTTALKISEYDVDLSNAKVYIRLVYYDGTSVSNGIINYASMEASTNGTGWAAYTLTDLPNIPYKSLAYGVRSPVGITHTWRNQTIPVAKTADIILKSDLTSIDALQYNSTTYTLNIVGTGTGTIKIRAEKPASVKINNITYEEGNKWIYNPSEKILIITDTWFTKTITISWAFPTPSTAFVPYVLIFAMVVIVILLFFTRRKKESAPTTSPLTIKLCLRLEARILTLWCLRFQP